MNILTQNSYKLPFQSETTWYLFCLNKKPIHPVTGMGSHWNHAEFLSSLTTAVNSTLNGDYYLGLGIHGISDGFALDLDSCFFINDLVDGPSLHKWAEPIVDWAIRSGLYIEKSVSGTGLHIIGNCSGFSQKLHTTHLYTKEDKANKTKSQQIEFYLSTADDKCTRGLLITGDLYEPSRYNFNAPLPTMTKDDFIGLFERVKAVKLVRAITQSDFKVTKEKAVKEEDINLIESEQLITNDVMHIALFDDHIKYLYHYEDNLQRSYNDLKLEYPNLKVSFYQKVNTENGNSENDFIFVLLLTKYSNRRDILIDCLVSSPRGLHPERVKKLNEPHFADGRTYAEGTVDKALAGAMTHIQESKAEAGEVCMSYTAGMNYLNSRYVRYQTQKEMKVINFYFTNEGYVHRVYDQDSVRDELNNLYIISKKNDKEIKKIKLFDVWFHSNQTHYMKDMTFIPNGPPVVYDNLCHYYYFNTFRGFAVTPHEQMELVQVWLDYVKEVMCSNDQDDYDYFINYFAHLFQKPEVLAGVALVLKSDKGIGKNVVLETIQNILGYQLFFTSTKTKDLAGDFNKNVASKLLIIANEALFAGDHAAQDNMKALISDPLISSTEKHKDSVMVRNYARVIILSNRSTAINYDPSERRYRFFNCNNEFADVRISPENFKKKERLMHLNYSKDYLTGDDSTLSIKLQEGLLHFFMHHDISHFNPRIFEFGKNAGTIRSESINPVCQFFFNFLQTGRFEFRDYELNGFETIKVYHDTPEELMFSPQELYNCYVKYSEKYLPKTPMFDLNKFKRTFAEFFLDGQQGTVKMRRRKTEGTIRVWKLGESRITLSLKYQLDGDLD